MQQNNTMNLSIISVYRQHQGYGKKLLGKQEEILKKMEIAKVGIQEFEHSDFAQYLVKKYNTKIIRDNIGLIKGQVELCIDLK